MLRTSTVLASMLVAATSVTTRAQQPREPIVLTVEGIADPTALRTALSERVGGPVVGLAQGLDPRWTYVSVAFEDARAMVAIRGAEDSLVVHPIDARGEGGWLLEGLVELLAPDRSEEVEETSDAPAGSLLSWNGDLAVMHARRMLRPWPMQAWPASTTWARERASGLSTPRPADAL